MQGVPHPVASLGEATDHVARGRPALNVVLHALLLSLDCMSAWATGECAVDLRTLRDRYPAARALHYSRVCSALQPTRRLTETVSALELFACPTRGASDVFPVAM